MYRLRIASEDKVRMQRRLFLMNDKKEIRTQRQMSSDFSGLVEHRRFELLTPTLPVLCATNCANAPSTGIIIA